MVVTALKFFLSSDDPKEDEDKSDSDVSYLFWLFNFGIISKISYGDKTVTIESKIWVSLLGIEPVTLRLWGEAIAMSYEDDQVLLRTS